MNVTDTTDVVIHPQTGEVLDLQSLTDDQITNDYKRLRELEAQVRDVRRAFENDLERRRRGLAGSAKAVQGAGVAAARTVTRKWHPDLTRQALQSLVDDGILPAAEAAAACPDKTVPHPDGRKCNAILERLSDDGEEDHYRSFKAARAVHERWTVEEVQQ